MTTKSSKNRTRKAPTAGGWRFMFEITPGYKRELEAAGYDYLYLKDQIMQEAFNYLEECIRSPLNEDYNIANQRHFQDENGNFDNALFDEISVIYTWDAEPECMENNYDPVPSDGCIDESWVEYIDIDWSNPEGIGKS